MGARDLRHAGSPCARRARVQVRGQHARQRGGGQGDAAAAHQVPVGALRQRRPRDQDGERHQDALPLQHEPRRLRGVPGGRSHRRRGPGQCARHRSEPELPGPVRHGQVQQGDGARGGRPDELDPVAAVRALRQPPRRLPGGQLPVRRQRERLQRPVHAAAQLEHQRAQAQPHRGQRPVPTPGRDLRQGPPHHAPGPALRALPERVLRRGHHQRGAVVQRHRGHAGLELRAGRLPGAHHRDGLRQVPRGRRAAQVLGGAPRAPAAVHRAGAPRHPRVRAQHHRHAHRRGRGPSGRRQPLQLQPDIRRLLEAGPPRAPQPHRAGRQLRPAARRGGGAAGRALRDAHGRDPHAGRPAALGVGQRLPDHRERGQHALPHQPRGAGAPGRAGEPERADSELRLRGQRVQSVLQLPEDDLGCEYLLAPACGLPNPFIPPFR